MGREMTFIGCVHVHLHPFTTLARMPFIATGVVTQIAKVPGKYVYRFSNKWGPPQIENHLLRIIGPSGISSPFSRSFLRNRLGNIEPTIHGSSNPDAKIRMPCGARSIFVIEDRSTLKYGRPVGKKSTENHPLENSITSSEKRIQANGQLTRNGNVP